MLNEVVMRGGWCSVDSTGMEPAKAWLAKVGHHDNEVGAYNCFGVTAPLAICRAALMALKVQP